MASEAMEVTLSLLKMFSTSLSAKSSSFLFSLTVKPISMVLERCFLAVASNFLATLAEFGAEPLLMSTELRSESRFLDKSLEARVRTRA